ncbi:noncanonical pyrimidine nucleotidase, YjjG family [Rasiella rasia]|uniref:Noncanonical pyrimidine nucleotidase, YjjG family n=1 Tax=Rasiella rasia TaxID=2744027 RepID=A0A6G6GLF8_9FLAO|nr:YjjG family noncanonical pyrimidine nucleotidase [Rasiella rasia]QIE59243.1 noncanonical pyrimidine nucleotidase, YjjG family [Rasiella rasia]
MRNITDVFFDLDHTLWDFDKNSGLAFQRVFNKHRVELKLAQFLEVYEPINFNYWKAYREERVTKQELRRGRLIDTFAAFQMVYPMNVIDEMAVSYIDELPGNNYLLEGASEILTYLASSYNLHIITNGFTEVQGIKLKNSDIAHFFKTVTSSEEVGVKKPNKLVFETALQKANSSAAKSIMIGDTFEADIVGANAVGMKTIFYNYRNENIFGNHITIHHLREIKNYL